MDLPHFESLETVPDHLTTRAGLKSLGLKTHRPPPVATVTSYGKTVFLYDLTRLEEPKPLQEQEGTAASPTPRKRAK